jgi:hypothetical protein
VAHPRIRRRQHRPTRRLRHPPTPQPARRPKRRR